MQIGGGGLFTVSLAHLGGRTVGFCLSFGLPRLPRQICCVFSSSWQPGDWFCWTLWPRLYFQALRLVWGKRGLDFPRLLAVRTAVPCPWVTRWHWAPRRSLLGRLGFAPFLRRLRWQTIPGDVSSPDPALCPWAESSGEVCHCATAPCCLTLVGLISLSTWGVTGHCRAHVE